MKRVLFVVLCCAGFASLAEEPNVAAPQGAFGVSTNSHMTPVPRTAPRVFKNSTNSLPSSAVLITPTK
jgi:hypothetical protein